MAYFEEIRETAEYRKWFENLRDRRASLVIAARLARLIASGTGDIKPVGGKVLELRVDTGPGYRVYFCTRGTRLLLLLAGGDKDGQKRDIRTAQQLAASVDGT